MNIMKELSYYLDKLKIEYEYQNEDDTIVIDFAQKPDNSEYPINYQIFEITYSSETECFILELTSTMNIKQYPKYLIVGPLSSHQKHMKHGLYPTTHTF